MARARGLTLSCASGGAPTQFLDRVPRRHGGELLGMTGVVGVDIRRRHGDRLTATSQAEPLDHQSVAPGDVVHDHPHRPLLAGHHRGPLRLVERLGQSDDLIVRRLELAGDRFRVGVRLGHYEAGTTATVTSISTAPPRGNAATPMADRV
jgi:hypothetical protein